LGQSILEQSFPLSGHLMKVLDSLVSFLVLWLALMSLLRLLAVLSA
jgi:hypothetical protein